MTKIRLFIICLCLVFSCSKPDIKDTMLDGDLVFDPSLYKPEEYLVSAKYPNPTAEDVNKHIILTIHGYSATTFEWKEFSDWSQNQPYRISQVLLGGHGRNYENFKSSTWQDWGSSIEEEYEKLVALGYTKISLAGSSTGATLLLEMIGSGYFNSKISPKNIFSIDPIVVSSNKLQSIAGIIGPMIVYVEVDQTAEEDKYWYHYRPQETISELNEVMKVARKKLENGMTLPTNTYLKVFQSLHDPVASTTSSVLIYKGLKTSTGQKIDVELMDSDIHVFTRLNLRTGVTAKQKANQESAFSQMANKLSE